MKTKLIALAAVGATAAAAVPAYAAVRTIKVDDNKFVAKSVTVNKNDTVRFRWTGNAPHNVVRTSGPSFTKISTRTRGTISRKMRRKGTYKLVCTIHPGMNLTLRVR